MNYSELERHSGEQYAALLAYVGLELKLVFTRRQIADAHEVLPKDALRRAASSVREAIASKGQKGGEYWHNRVQPYIRAIWPKSIDKNDEGISESFARICVAAMDKFDQALKELRPWLGPLEHPEMAVMELHQSKLPSLHPHSVLDWLDRIIGPYPTWGVLPEHLASCLNDIEAADPQLVDDSRFKRLRALVVQFGR